MYFVKIKIPNNNSSKIKHTINEELELKYLNQTANIRIHYDIDSIIIETLLTLPFYKYAERYSVAKQCASYIIKELRKKYVDPNTENPFLNEEYGFGSLHKKVFMTLISNSEVVRQDLDDRLDNIILFGNLVIHKLIIELELGNEIVNRIFDNLFDCNILGRYMNLRWNRVNNCISIGRSFRDNNILRVSVNGNINGIDISCVDPFVKFDNNLSTLYGALDISAGMVYDVVLKSAHFCRAIDMERSCIESTDIKRLNQRNDNKRSLMSIGLIGFRDMIDYSHGYAEYEVHYDNYDNRSVETILDNIDYLFCTGDKYKEIISRTFPTSARLREILDGMDRLEAMGIEFIIPFDITGINNNLKNDFYRAIKVGYKDCKFYNLRQKSESNTSDDYREIYYKFWLEKTNGDDLICQEKCH